MDPFIWVMGGFFISVLTTTYFIEHKVAWEIAWINKSKNKIPAKRRIN